MSIRRRDFITLLGGAAAWPIAARAQQAALPVIGFLGSGTSQGYAKFVAEFRKGLSETGYVEGRNLAIEFRWADGEYGRLPELAADLVRRQVAVIATNGNAALAAKAATTTIPIVFAVGVDPVQTGLVASLSRPGGNATGVNFLIGELLSKQLGLLHELLPTARRVGLLVNPSNTVPAELAQKDATDAASVMGFQIDVVQAGDSREIEGAFETLVRNKVDALLGGPDGFLVSRSLQIATLATRHGIPAVYNVREYADAGGLMSYGTSQTGALRQVGLYTGQILKGAKPADLPVMQSTRFELVINLPTAKALGLTVPPTLLAIADEVIE